MDVFIERENRKRKLSFAGSVSDLLIKLGVNPETVLVVRNDEVVTEDEILVDSDSVRLLSIISGG